MEWITDGSKPETKRIEDDLYSSVKVVVLIYGTTPVVAEWQTGEYYEHWYCPAYEEIIEGVTAWCDCIPKINKTINF